jgi:hypothetical protein
MTISVTSQVHHMKEQTDKHTIDAFPRRRGRPPTGKAMSDADRAAKYRDRKRIEREAEERAQRRLQMGREISALISSGQLPAELLDTLAAAINRNEGLVQRVLGLRQPGISVTKNQIRSTSREKPNNRDSSRSKKSVTKKVEPKKRKS